MNDNDGCWNEADGWMLIRRSSRSIDDDLGAEVVVMVEDAIYSHTKEEVEDNIAREKPASIFYKGKICVFETSGNLLSNYLGGVKKDSA